MEKVCTKITPKSLLEHGFKRFKATNGICYVKGNVAVAYYRVFWVACSILNDTIYLQRIYFNCLEEVEFFA